jgi:RNAse (barnase) inhibitor barstar
MNKFMYIGSEKQLNHKEKLFLIKKNIIDKSELFDIYAEQLSFPYYFGRNWDALYDCLMDLNWIEEKSISIVHSDIPFINDKADRNTYINLLYDVIRANENDKKHKINIYFPEFYEEDVEKIIANAQA